AVTVTATPVVDVSKVESSTRLPNQAVGGLPNNGRNFLNLTLLTPNVATVQGPDGDELTAAGQRGIHNNVSVDGADFNNPFFGGPLKRDKAFFFIAYDQQVYDEIKQKARPSSPALDSLTRWMDTAFAGALRGDFGPISRTNNARAGLVKIDWRLSERHNLSVKYNHTWSQQENGTFDVDAWARSANGLEKDYSNAVNGSLVSYLSSRAANEFRFQYSREDRPRPYPGPTSPALGPNPTGPGPRPFPDTGMDFANGF